MNCPKCGNFLPDGTPSCPVCHEPTAQAGFAPYAQQGYSADYGAFPQQYQQPGTYPSASGGQSQGYVPTAEPQQAMSGYPQGYQPAQGYYAPPQQPSTGRAFIDALTRLPSVFRSTFTNAGDTLASLMERRDYITCGLVTVLTLLLSFVGGMVMTRGVVSFVLSGFSWLSGVPLASTSAGMNQGVVFLASRISAGVGGITALCQFFAMLTPTAVAVVYLCAVCKLPFSMLLFSAILTVTTIPTVACAFAAAVLSIASPALGLLVAVFSMVFSYIVLGGVLSRATGKPDAQLACVKMVLICLSLLLTLLLSLLLGGLLLGGVGRTLATLFQNSGSFL